MTQIIVDLDPEASEEDARIQLQERVAEALADLSHATDAPVGVSLSAQFTPDDVNFGDDAWMARLAEVQGWLRLDPELRLTTPKQFLEDVVESLGFKDFAQGVDTSTHTLRLSETALERLGERAELAARLQQTYLATFESESGSQDAATAAWAEAWSGEEDTTEAIAPEPVTAKADVWHIFQLTKKKLNLAPSYQRGDVWRTGDRQALIESILRGIPLPSIILLRTSGATPHDVVDGKQRLTAILRFIGQHPIAVQKVAEAHARHPEADLASLFATNYGKFRAAWKRYEGPLTAKQEDEYYFPFKLRNDGKGGLVGPDLEPLRGQYFTQIKDRFIHVADQEVSVEELFEGAPDYKVPVIEYTKASQRQIHEVFKLYNKQGMHLNAEEIRNAVYHDIELTRAILVAAGDASAQSTISEIAPSLVNVPNIADLGKTLAEYGFGEARYRRTKVLGWVLATLLNDSQGKLLPSTARHTDLLLGRVQDDEAHPLRSRERLRALFALLARATEMHAAHDELWPEKFRGDGKSSKWQDLQLVGSLVGVVIAMAAAPTDVEQRLDGAAAEIRATALADWKRPPNPQTRSQWDYIARVAAGVVEHLGLDIAAASDEIRSKFGSSGVDSMLASIIPAKAND